MCISKKYLICAKAECKNTLQELPDLPESARIAYHEKLKLVLVCALLDILYEDNLVRIKGASLSEGS